MKLTNNTILITGGTSGFGLEFAKQLIKLGNTVIITGRNEVKLEQTKKLLPGVHTFQSDVSDPKAIEVLFEKVTQQFPALNMLINNAGEMRKINLHDTSNDVNTITREIEINLSGPIRMVQEFLPYLKTKKTAAILNVTSGLALVPFPVSPVYGATKSGLRSYTKSLRVQLKNTDIKVFELLPPAASTPLIDKFNMDSKSLMAADNVIAAAIKGMQKDKLEIYPGMAKILHFLSRLAPRFIFAQLSKPVDVMLAEKK
jgi:uncharacterized oxidoreductase